MSVSPRSYVQNKTSRASLSVYVPPGLHEIHSDFSAELCTEDPFFSFQGTISSRYKYSGPWTAIIALQDTVDKHGINVVDDLCIILLYTTYIVSYDTVLLTSSLTRAAMLHGLQRNRRHFVEIMACLIRICSQCGLS